MNFIYDLFIVKDAPDGSIYALLPYIITAVAIGVILASAYFIVWRAIEASLAKKLRAADATTAADGKTLRELGYKPFWSGILRYLFRSQACIIYKTISSDALDAHRLALMKQAGEVSDPADAVAEDALPDIIDFPTVADADQVASATDIAPVAEEDAGVAPEKEHPKKKRVRLRARLAVTPDTRFYIMPTRLEYAENHAMKFSRDDIWGFVFTCLGSAIIWLAALALLDPLVAFLM